MSAGAPRPDLLRVLARSLVACVLAEVALVLGLRALGWDLEPPAWAYALGWGLGAGVALAVAEAALWRHGLVPALLGGAALAPLAPLGAGFELAFVQTWSSREATEALVVAARVSDPRAVLGLVAGALALYGPLLVALKRGWSPAGQALAMAAGAAAWGVGLLLLDPLPIDEALTWREVPLALLVPALVIPPGRRLGDRLVRALRGRRAAARARAPVRRGRALQLAALACAALWIARAPSFSDRPVEFAHDDLALALGADAATLVALGDRACEESSWLPSRMTSYVFTSSGFQRASLVSIHPSDGLAHGLGVLSSLRGDGDRTDWGRDPPRRLDPLVCWGLAADQGSVEAIRRLVGVEEPVSVRWAPDVPDAERLAWLRRGVELGDAACKAALGTLLVERPGTTLSPFGPPPPGSLHPGDAELVAEAFRLLREAEAQGVPDAGWRLLRALRLAPSETAEEAFERLDEHLARARRASDLSELDANQRARAALRAHLLAERDR